MVPNQVAYLCSVQRHVEAARPVQLRGQVGVLARLGQHVVEGTPCAPLRDHAGGVQADAHEEARCLGAAAQP